MNQWELDKVDEWVNEIAVAPVRKFYPTAVAKDTGLPLADVFSRLLKLVRENKVGLQWEIRCPNCSMTIAEDQSGATDKTFYCYQCNDDIEASPDIVFPVFSVMPDYKAYLKSKKKHKTTSPKLLGTYAKTLSRSRCHV